MTKKTTAVKVQIVKTKRLTLTEINALADLISDRLVDAIEKNNKTYKLNPEYKTELKAIKTQHGVLKAERALIALQEKHSKVKFEISGSDEYYKELRELDNRYYKYAHRLQQRGDIKNKLILEQVNNSESIYDIADRMVQEFMNK